MMKQQSIVRYPRRRVLRSILRRLAFEALGTISNLEVVGRENIPASGPLLVVANHFSFLDPVAMVSIAPWPIEFVGGFQMPNAPQTVTWIPKVWGYFPVYRGTASRQALRDAEIVLSQKGVLGIFPEGGSWATVLRPARPGAAFLAARTHAQILPMGFDGLTNVFPRIRKYRRAKVTLRIGKPFGPLDISGQGRDRRHQIDEIGHRIMSSIAQLILPERRGFYSDDPTIRAAAEGTEIYPWAETPESVMV